MAIRDVFKVSRKTFINPSAWIDYNYLKYQNKTLWAVLKTIFAKPQPTEGETFEQAMKRLNLTAADVKSTASQYRRYAFFFLIIGLLVFYYAFYLLFMHHTITSWFLGLAASSLFFAQAFKYDFWAFQMRRRKLGVTFKEWKHFVLGGKEQSHE